MKRQEAITKIVGRTEWEGGIVECITEGHLTYKDFIDAEAPNRVLDAYERIKGISLEIGLIEDWIEEVA